MSCGGVIEADSKTDDDDNEHEVREEEKEKEEEEEEERNGQRKEGRETIFLKQRKLTSHRCSDMEQDAHTHNIFSFLYARQEVKRPHKEKKK